MRGIGVTEAEMGVGDSTLMLIYLSFAIHGGRETRSFTYKEVTLGVEYSWECSGVL